MQASVHEAKANLSKLLVKVSRGERVVITRYGIPAAEPVPLEWCVGEARQLEECHLTSTR